MSDIILSDKEKRQVNKLLEFDSLKIFAAFRDIIMNGPSLLISTNDSYWKNKENIICFHHDLLYGDPCQEAEIEMSLTYDIPAFVDLLKRLANDDYISIIPGQPCNAIVCGSSRLPASAYPQLSHDLISCKVYDDIGMQVFSLNKDSSGDLFVCVNGHKSNFFTCIPIIINGDDLTTLLSSSLHIHQKLFNYVESGFRTESDALNEKIDILDLHIQDSKRELLERLGGLYNAVIEHNSMVHTIHHQEPSLFTKLRESLKQKNLKSFKSSLSSLFSSIAYDSIKEADKEGYYHVMLHTIFSLIGGFTIGNEIETNNERIDMVVRLEERTYIFEFKFEPKVDKSDEGLKQSFKYVNAYKNEGREIVCVGFGFVTDKEYRNVVNFKSRTKFKPPKRD